MARGGEMEYGKKPFKELASDEPSHLGGGSSAWQDTEVGRPIKGRLASQHKSGKKVYDMFPQSEVGGHYSRSGSPGTSGSDVE